MMKKQATMSTLGAPWNPAPPRQIITGEGEYAISMGDDDTAARDHFRDRFQIRIGILHYCC